MKNVAKIQLVCEQCKGTFQKYPSQVKIKGHGRFCSQTCMWESRRNGSVYTCVRCDESFYRRDGESAKNKEGGKVYCSRECYMSDRKDLMKKNVYPKKNATHIHRIMGERLIGRKLMKGEVVHHIDGNKHNYEGSNLMIFASQADHASYHQRVKKGGTL